jgi:hypothetical protein
MNMARYQNGLLTLYTDFSYRIPSNSTFNSWYTCKGPFMTLWKFGFERAAKEVHLQFNQVQTKCTPVVNKWKHNSSRMHDFTYVRTEVNWKHIMWVLSWVEFILLPTCLENRENTAGGIRHADHVAPSIPTSWQSLRRQEAVARSV